jgi:hypothetical protein
LLAFCLFTIARPSLGLSIGVGKPNLRNTRFESSKKPEITIFVRYLKGNILIAPIKIPLP